MRCYFQTHAPQWNTHWIERRPDEPGLVADNCVSTSRTLKQQCRRDDLWCQETKSGRSPCGAAVRQPIRWNSWRVTHIRSALSRRAFWVEPRPFVLCGNIVVLDAKWRHPAAGQPHLPRQLVWPTIRQQSSNDSVKRLIAKDRKNNSSTKKEQSQLC